MRQSNAAASITVFLTCLGCGLLPGSAAEAQASLPTPVPLVVLYQVQLVGNGYTDYMTSFTQNEAMKLNAIGQIAYIFAKTGNPYYRLLNASAPDHMDSINPGESGFANEGQNGGVLPEGQQNSVPGTTAVQRFRNPSSSNGDHLSSTPSERMQDGTPASYTLEGTIGYGFGRFGKSASVLNTWTLGNATVSADYVAGGAISAWSWNGTQFINTDDYGRYMQTDIFFTGANGTIYNPIEAGDSVGGGNRIYMHGSPVINNQVTNGVLITKALPLEYGLGTNVGGLNSSPDQPMVYTNMILGKQVTLNFQNLGPVAQYTTYVQSPVQINNAKIEIPSAYFLKQFGMFYTYDAQHDVRTSVNLQNSCSTLNRYPPSNVQYSGGLIISDASMNNAIGIYRRLQSDQPQGSDFEMYDFRNCANTTKWSLFWNGTINPGDNYYTSYVVNGTVAQVQALMKQLYTSGY